MCLSLRFFINTSNKSKVTKNFSVCQELYICMLIFVHSQLFTNQTVLSYGQTFSYENWCSFILQPYYFQKMCIWNVISVVSAKFVGQYLISYHILLTFYTSLILIQLYSVLSRTIKADVYDRSLPHEPVNDSLHVCYINSPFVESCTSCLWP